MEKLMNNDQAASFLNISPYSLRGKVSRQEIPFIKIGRRVLFSPSDLQAFIQQNTHVPRVQRENQ